MTTKTDKLINRLISLFEKEKSTKGEYLIENGLCDLVLLELKEIKKVAKEDSFQDKYNNGDI